MMFQLNSLFESENGKKQIKIRNFQALIDDNYNHNSKTAMNSNTMSHGGFMFNTTNSLHRGLTSLTSGSVPEELLRQIQLNLRISTSVNANNSDATVTKVMISGDSHSSSMLSQAASGIFTQYAVGEEHGLKLSSLRGLENYYV